MLTMGRPHSGWLDMSKPFIAAYKAGSTDVSSFIEEDELIYWYRPTLRTINCDATDTTMVPANNGSGNYFMGRPNGWETMSDSVFVVSMLTSAGQISVTSGGNSKTFDAPAGASAFAVDMGVGEQKFALLRDGATVMSVTSLRDVSDVCPCGLYNFNAYVGTLTCSGGGEADPLGPDGLASLTIGLHVSTCKATPSLGTPLPGSCTGGGGGGGSPPGTTSNGATSSPRPTSVVSTTKPPSHPTTTMITTTAPPTSAPACEGRTITASSQIFPTNCLQPGDIWAGPPAQATPDHCDGSTCTASIGLELY